MTAIEPADDWPRHTERKGWLARDIDREAITYRLSAEELGALKRLVERCKASGKALTELRQDDFRDAALDGALRRLAREMKHGQGLVMIAGVPLGDYSLDDLRILYWGIGTHFGDAVSQNIDGDLMGEVRVRETRVKMRAYSAPGALPIHNDRIDMLSLFSIQKALTGGATVFASALAVYETIKRERPDLLAILERGFHQFRAGEQPEGEGPVTAHRVPVFGRKDGLLTALFSGNSLLRHQKQNIPGGVTAEEEEALAFLNDVSKRPEFHIPILLEPGEMVFINNYEILHSRTDFVDGEAPEQKRFLLRLWLQGRPWRPKPDAMLVIRNKSGQQGIDPKPVAEPQVA
jgi:hypothetical protein